MHIEQISNLDALLAMLAVIAFAALIFRIVPLGGDRPPSPRSYAVTEVVGHDRALAKYMVVTTAALELGGVHLAIRSVPLVADWLERGGYGGHLVRDIAYSHMMIVMGGTIAVTGLTWYALPRVLQRPLFSGTLAQLAFWGTVVGAAGFYLSNVIAGGWMAAMANSGRSAAEIDDAVGIWRALATGLSASVMGLGYWTYVANVVLTVLGLGRTSGARPHLHLAKFFFVGALGLFAGTVQGVLQVVPENVDWLHSAGIPGTYIDPISHAHINLVTGVLSIVAGVVFYVTHPDDTRPGDRRIEQFVFWTMIPGSIAFYLSFIYLGFTEGGMIIDRGLTFTQAAKALGPLHAVPLTVSGAVMLVGIWLFIWVLIKRLCAPQFFAKGGIAVALGAATLALGTLQGFVQLLPEVKTWLVASGPAGTAVAEAHAQLNILGGVLMILVGCMFVVGSPLFASSPQLQLVRRTSLLLGSGAIIYYAAALLVAVFAGVAIQRGQPVLQALNQTQSWGSPGMILGALLYTLGAGLAFAFVWKTTRESRTEGWRNMLAAVAKNNSSGAPWRRRTPNAQLLIPEVVAALFGFPGVGWILSGRASIGVPLILGGSAVSWAIFPLLLSPYGEGQLPHLDPLALEIYLVVSAVLSAITLFAVQVGVGRRRHKTLQS